MLLAASPRRAGGLSPVELLANLAAWLGVSLLIGLTEELAFRGYLQRILARVACGLAQAATSLIFGLMHVSNPHESVIGILNVFGAGLLSAWRSSAPVRCGGPSGFMEAGIFRKIFSTARIQSPSSR